MGRDAIERVQVEHLYLEVAQAGGGGGQRVGAADSGQQANRPAAASAVGMKVDLRMGSLGVWLVCGVMHSMTARELLIAGQEVKRSGCVCHPLGTLTP